MLALVRSSCTGSVLRHVFFGVLIFACHRLESTTSQPLGVGGLVDAVCVLPCGIFAVLEYMPICYSQFSVGTSLFDWLIDLLCDRDVWRVRSYAGIADLKRSTFVQPLLSFPCFTGTYSNRHHNTFIGTYLCVSAVHCSIWTACVGILSRLADSTTDIWFCISRQRAASL